MNRNTESNKLIVHISSEKNLLASSPLCLHFYFFVFLILIVLFSSVPFMRLWISIEIKSFYLRELFKMTTLYFKIDFQELFRTAI